MSVFSAVYVVQYRIPCVCHFGHHRVTFPSVSPPVVWTTRRQLGAYYYYYYYY